ncbi:bifunctional sugar-1-phosphate nucleotidylyltransferase/acetyltransferase [Halonotius roseus]|uniref:Bifunctional protein GlmU n=1 Tax=Halonotius roseus TaxID=2511997 RepID=A0A544QS53_9EURY|nr:bifunctional sugar-1-phosphate nucleotidylyltransferase/acetyltransferase [Halonotius roseus]TQQ82256.1 glucose-1-phosphate thymidylyltransferase [Halonotius roseus]
MQTVVLAAGSGTRMRPLTETQPKPTLPVAGRPLIGHALSGAAAAGASRFIIVVNPHTSAVEEAIGETVDGVPVEYVTQTEQRGTADAVAAALDALDPEPFVVLNGDSLYDEASLAKLYASTPAVGSFRVDNPSSYGVLTVTDGRVTDVVEKPTDPESNLINAGGYALPTEVQQWLDVPESERGELEFTDVLLRVCETFDVTPVSFDRWLDVGRPWDLLAANEWKTPEVEPTIEGTVDDDATLSGNVHVAPGATVRSGVVIDGPAYIDTGATVGPNAYIRGTTYVGPDAKVGHAVEVKNSVLMAGATVGHLSYVGDSILGCDTNLGAGTKIANLRHDGQPVQLTVKGERVSTGRRKFGVVLGAGAKTGINTSLNAGLTLSPGAATTPGEVVTRDR